MQFVIKHYFSLFIRVSIVYCLVDLLPKTLTVFLHGYFKIYSTVINYRH